MVDFSKFMVRGNRFQALPETVIPPLKMPVKPAPIVKEPAPVVSTPVSIPQIDPAVLAQIQEQFNIPVQAPPPPPPVEMAPPPPPVAPPVQVPPPVFQAEPVPAPIPQPAPPPPPPPVETAPVMPPSLPTPVNPPKVIPGESGPIIANPNEPPIVPPPPVQVPPPVVQPAPPPPPPPVEVAPPPPVEVAPPPPPIPQISPEVLAQIQQEFNIPAATVAPPPPVQVPPPVVQPEGIATLPQAPVEPPAPPVQVPPPVVQPAPVPEAVQPPPAPVAQEFSLPPRRISEPVSQPEPLAGPGMPTPSGGFLPGIDLNNLDLSGLAVPNQVQPAPEPAPAPVDPSLYSDPELGRGVEPGFGGTRGVSPQSPTEQMGSNYIEPRDGPGFGGPRGEGFDPAGPRGAAGLNQGPRPELSGPSGAAGMGGDDVTGIETMAPAVGFGDYINSEVNEAGLPAGAQTNTSESISLPDGSTFDLGSLDLSGIGQGFGGFELGNFEIGNVDPSLYSDPNLGGSQAPPPGQNTAGQGINETYGPTFNGPGRGGLGQGGPNFPQDAVDEAEGTNPNPNATFTPESVDLSGLDLSGLNINLGEGFDAGGFNQGDIGFGPADVGGGYIQGGDPYNPTVNDTGNPYPFIPDGIDTSQMTPDQLAGLNTFYENGGVDGLNLNFGGLYGGGSYTGTGGTGTTDGSYTVTPVDPVGDLGVGDDTGGASDPIDVTTPYVPPNVRAASSYGLTGATQTMPVAPNPFARPESQQGLGSLAGGG